MRAVQREAKAIRTRRNSGIEGGRPRRLLASLPQKNKDFYHYEARSAPSHQWRYQASKPKKTRARPSAAVIHDEGGLYAEVFSDVHTLEAVAADWISRYEGDSASAMADMINFVLRCTGCSLQIDVHDIEDPDNAPSKLEDLQNEFHAQNITSYPLVSKTKADASFRATMTGFFDVLIQAAHASNLLHRDDLFIENLETWVVAMSDSAISHFDTPLRSWPSIAEDTAKIMRQKEGEQKKKSVNKERVKALEVKIKEEDAKRDSMQKRAEELFDAVYSHRYRDVDPKIRVDCVSAFGTWITACPEVFFSGQYIRYLGWVLSDTASPTRAEVIKQLTRLYKNKENVGRLRAFTERFRPRLVEMAIRDAEPNIRAATVDLLGMIRGTGLLEPDDIDNVGRLVFDSDPKVRKAVASFFAENVQDLYESVIDDLGGDETIDEVVGDELEENFDAPRKSWLMFKCVAEALQGYDAEEDTPGEPQILTASGEESRSALAAQAVCDGVKNLEKWEVLAGYLLYDLSNADTTSSDPEQAFKARCQLSERENVILLDMLHVAIKSTLVEAIHSESDSKGKSTKARKERSRQIQEATALHLAQIIPRMLKKFGGDPTTATAVLKLGQVLDLEIFQELRQDSTTYASLLNDIGRQFLTHDDQGVLTEARTTLLHARGFEDLEEVTEGKVNMLWEDNLKVLHAYQGSGVEIALPHLLKCVRRIQHLATISDCKSQFEALPRTSKKDPSPERLLDILLNLIRQASDQNNMDEELIELNNHLLQSATQSVLFYYMWVVRSLRAASEEGKQIALPDFQPFAKALLSIMGKTSISERVQQEMAGTYLELYTLFATFRHIKTDSASLIKIQHVPASAQRLLSSIFASAEKSFAKKSRRPIELAPDDAPEDSDIGELPSDDDEEDLEDTQQRQTSTLLIEKALCELTGKLVLAIIGRVLDSEGSDKDNLKARLLRNRAKLGPNYKEVVAHLDPPKPKRKPVRKAAPKKKATIPQEEEIESIEDAEEEGRRFEEGGEEDLRERELIEDRIEDRSDEDEDAGGQNGAAEDVDDEIMGD